MTVGIQFPEDFLTCVRFHGHLCPGLAIGYAATKAGAGILGVTPSEDEELVAIVENDSCAVDAIQVLLSCTFGKGNLIFRNWGKQVFTFFDRRTGRGVRVSFTGDVPGREQRHALRQKIDSGTADSSDRKRLKDAIDQAVLELIYSDPAGFFDLKEIRMEPPPQAQIVSTRTCDGCGERTVEGRMVEKDGRFFCRECMGE